MAECRAGGGDDVVSCITASSQGLTQTTRSPDSAPEQVNAWPPPVALSCTQGSPDTAPEQPPFSSSQGSGSLSPLQPTLDVPSPLLALFASTVPRLRPVAQDCAGGTYLVEDAATGAPVGVFKPSDEEPATEGNPKGVTSQEELGKAGFQPGEMWRREIAAYAVDQGLAGVPETVEFTTGGQKGSLQAFRRSLGESWDFLPGKFTAECVRRVALLDLVILNCDRHGGNMLVSEEGDGLIPIDHGLCFPSSLEDLDFEWQYWPQSSTPFDAEERRWAAALPAGVELSAALQRMGIDTASADLAGCAAAVLKVGVETGRTARALASFWRREQLGEPSSLECLIVEAAGNYAILERLARDAMTQPPPLPPCSVLGPPSILGSCPPQSAAPLLVNSL